MRRWMISLALVAVALGSLPQPGGTAPAPSLDAYRGLGAWVDIYDDALWKNPEGAVATMASYRVRTLYIETANYKAKKDVVYPVGIDRFIDAAHARGMRIVAWYLPSFNNIDRDLRRSLAAINRQTATGQRFDSFGLDIEASVVTDPKLRSQRTLELSARIRAAVGPSYPLSAIIPSPRGMLYRPDYWPGFPFADLTKYYDVFQPMSYFSYRTSGAAGASKYIADNISITRTKTGDRTIPIHIIGGIADATSGPEVRGMIHAARERGILGASLYDFATSGPEDWAEVRRMPANPVERPALPLQLPAAPALGNITGGDHTHPKEVFYKTGGVSGSRRLRFQAFGVQSGEVAILVNWRKLRDVVPTAEGSWSLTRGTTIPGSYLKSSGTNVISFVADGNYPRWSTWGVRQVSLS